MKSIHKIFLFIVVLSGITFGSFVSIYSWDGVVYFVDADKPRLPAAIESELKLDNIKSYTIAKSIKNEILNHTKISWNFEQIDIQLTQGVIRQQGDALRSSCTLFSTVGLKFRATGISINGNPAYLNIELPCSAQEGSDLLKKVTIFKNQMRNKRYSTKGIKISFENTDGEWPEDWVLDEVRYFNSSGTSKDSFSVDLKGTPNAPQLKL